MVIGFLHPRSGSGLGPVRGAHVRPTHVFIRAGSAYYVVRPFLIGILFGAGGGAGVDGVDLLLVRSWFQDELG